MNINIKERNMFRGVLPSLRTKPTRVVWQVDGHTYSVVVSAGHPTEAVGHARSLARRQGMPGPPSCNWSTSTVSELPLGIVTKGVA
ncbi:MAG: hypothetical protein ACNA8W_10485 [Bradymonadaceae bacterium]